MSISINNNRAVQTNTETAHGVKTAELAKSQIEKEGQMALNLIQPSSSADASSVPPVGNRGHNISIAV